MSEPPTPSLGATERGTSTPIKSPLYYMGFPPDVRARAEYVNELVTPPRGPLSPNRPMSPIVAGSPHFPLSPRLPVSPRIFSPTMARIYPPDGPVPMPPGPPTSPIDLRSSKHLRDIRCHSRPKVAAAHLRSQHAELAISTAPEPYRAAAVERALGPPPPVSPGYVCGDDLLDVKTIGEKAGLMRAAMCAETNRANVRSYGTNHFSHNILRYPLGNPNRTSPVRLADSRVAGGRSPAYR